jgi:hypothetical protein
MPTLHLWSTPWPDYPLLQLAIVTTRIFGHIA